MYTHFYMSVVTLAQACVCVMNVCHFPLYIHEEHCFDTIPILYADKLQIVQPLSRQTKQTARNIPCTKTPQNLIALDPSDQNSDWYMLTAKRVKYESLKLLKRSN